MAKHRRISGETPNGGDYSEIYFFDVEGNNVDEKQAVRCAIRECTNSGELMAEIWGYCNPVTEG